MTESETSRMTAADYLASMLTDPWLMAGLGIGCLVLAIVVWLLRDERRMIRADRPRTVHAVRVETIAYPTVALTCDHCGEVASATAGTPVELLAALADWQAGHACPKTTAAVPGRR